MAEDDKPRGEPAVKAKLPDPKSIARTDFTPHGISAGRGRPPRLNPKTAAEAKKRRRVMIAGLLVVALAIAGVVAFVVTRPGPKITATGAFGKEPKVKIPAEKLKPSGKLKTTELIKGKGPVVAKDGTAFVSTIFYKWDGKTSKKLSSTYEQNQPVPMAIGKTGIKGLDKALPGHAVGSRLVVEVPPAEAFGKEGNPQADVKGTDTLVFVIDVLAAYPKGATASGTEQKLTDKNLPKVEAGKPGEAPKITIPKADPPSKLQVKVLIQGNGPVVAKGDTLVTNYEGRIWNSGKLFDSSWQRGEFGTFPIGTGGVVPGWDKGLVGQKAGSRVLLVLPPSEGYGKTGQPQAGIKGTDTLVFVIDVLGSLPKS